MALTDDIHISLNSYWFYIHIIQVMCWPSNGRIDVATLSDSNVRIACLLVVPDERKQTLAVPELFHISSVCFSLYLQSDKNCN